MDRPRQHPTSGTRSRDASRTLLAGVALVVALAALAAWLVSPVERSTPPQGTPPGDGGPARSATDVTGEEQSQDVPVPLLPARPATKPLVLARQLDRAEAVIQDAASTSEQLAAAARLQQLATRDLLRMSAARRRLVLTNVDDATGRAMRPKLVAGRSLGALTDPEPRLPAWRIVAPPEPRVLIGYYLRAQRATGVPWQYLAAIHLVETRMGRIRGTSTAGAQGPMQFIPGTWAMYGRGSVHSHRDSVMAAGRLLRANGAPGDMGRAIYRYNLSKDYVRAVRSYAEHMRSDRRAYFGYYHWQVLYRHVDGTMLLPHGYPRVRPVRVGA